MNKPESITVENSSIIAGIGWDGQSTVSVEFNSGSVYEYFNVPYNTFREFANADSKGSFFARSIKGQYESRQVK
jgi:hypothetical protein